jgi:aspartyl aminopeptidase
LSHAGFTEVREDEPWNCTPGGYYVRRGGSIIAYRLGENLDKETPFRIVAAHVDSPGFKVKPHPNHHSSGWEQVAMEVYGSPILSSWMDREIGFAGRLILRGGEGQLVASSALVRIPSLAVHLDRSAQDSSTLDRQQHLMGVYGLAGGRDFMDVIASEAGCSADDVVSHDLFAYLTQGVESWGDNHQFIAGRGLDDLSSVYPALQAFLSAESDSRAVDVLACFDHEEVGSTTYAGARGTFLDHVVARISASLGASLSESHQARARSWTISADAAHSVHPNYPDKHDPDEKPIVGKGPVVKVNAGQRYATDAAGQELWASLSERGDVPYQVFVSNNAVSCGTTIGPLLASGLGIRTVDVGIPILSMHSSREMCAPQDVEWLEKVLTGFYGAGSMSVTAGS